jgi:hypothetical protein
VNNLGWLRDPRSDWWTAAGVVGTWLAAIGTIATSIVAVWLAGRDRRIDLQLTARSGAQECPAYPIERQTYSSASATPGGAP